MRGDEGQQVEAADHAQEIYASFSCGSGGLAPEMDSCVQGYEVDFACLGASLEL